MVITTKKQSGSGTHACMDAGESIGMLSFAMFIKDHSPDNSPESLHVAQPTPLAPSKSTQIHPSAMTLVPASRANDTSDEAGNIVEYGKNHLVQQLAVDFYNFFPNRRTQTKAGSRL